MVGVGLDESCSYLLHMPRKYRTLVPQCCWRRRWGHSGIDRISPKFYKHDREEYIYLRCDVPGTVYDM